MRDDLVDAGIPEPGKGALQRLWLPGWRRSKHIGEDRNRLTPSCVNRSDMCAPLTAFDGGKPRFRRIDPFATIRRGAYHGPQQRYR